MRFINFLVIILVMTLIFLTVAYATETVVANTPEVYEIQITDAIIAIITLFFSLLLGTVSFIIAKSSRLITKYLGINIDDKTRKYLEVALQRGILYAENKIQAKIVGGVKAPTTKDMKIALAADYVLSRVPDAINHFKLDRASVITMLEARLDTSQKIINQNDKKDNKLHISGIKNTSDNNLGEK